MNSLNLYHPNFYLKEGIQFLYKLLQLGSSSVVHSLLWYSFSYINLFVALNFWLVHTS